MIKNSLGRLRDELQHFSHDLFNPRSIESRFVLKLQLLSMLNYPIGYSKPSNLGRIVVVGHEFKYCTSKAALYTSVFDSNYLFEGREYFVEQIFIQRFGESHI